MYQCQLCLQTIAAGTPMVRVTVKQRFVQYPKREKIHPISDPDRPCRRKKRRRNDDPGGVGQQIADERSACPAYASAPALISG